MDLTQLQGLHRASRIALERGAERDLATAEAALRRLTIQIVVGPRIQDSAVLQAALLTAVNAGARTFLGGVHVVGAQGVRSCTPLAVTHDLASAVRALGGVPREQPLADVATILIGGAPRPRTSSIALRVEVQDWRAAVLPIDDATILSDDSAVAPAGIVAAAIALSEVFSALMGLHPEAGRREVGFSLWRPSSGAESWRSIAGPEPQHLPKELTVIGLGHLGQAYLWALASLPYAAPSEVEVTLQDRALIERENVSTSVLCTSDQIGDSKVRVSADWLEKRGFRTRMIERRFSELDQFAEDDPHLVLVGVDWSPTRAHVAAAATRVHGGIQVLDVGLGSDTQDFDELVLHASPFGPADLERWRAAPEREASRTASLASSQSMREVADASGLDACGSVRLAELSVAVPFVGAAAGAVVVSEVLRRLAGAPPVRTVSLRLRDLALGAPPVEHATAPSFIPSVSCMARGTGAPVVGGS
jgi:hypothetical protein